ncbi:MAG: IPT/TIG domain-containing protein, partial [Acidobacteria bacterium]|nr:IPT/TIG domain-containing protein [Acidobacteriota bacterium]
SNGTVQAWGDNADDQCTVPSTLGGVIQVVAGDLHTVALKSDGTVRAWGSNNYGQLNVPATLTSATQIAAGFRHTVALRTGGAVQAWGENIFGQCNVPLSLTAVRQVSAGTRHTAVLTTDGTVRAWGSNADEQCAVPASLAGVQHVAAGHQITVALKNNGTLVVWGRSSDRQFAIPDRLAAVSHVVSGRSHSVALARFTDQNGNGQRDTYEIMHGTSFALPAIASVTPNAAPRTQETTITIAGTNLGGAFVEVGDVAAQAVMVNPAGTSLTATIPASESSGAKDVAVTTIGGTMIRPRGFAHADPPSIAGVLPSAGPLAGGTSITLTGTNLFGASVTVGDVPASAVAVNAAGTSLTASSPASATPGTRTIAITAVGGTASLANAFTYVAPPIVTSVSPSSGPLTAGTIITITGTNLAGATVKIGDVAATNVVVNAQGTSLTARAPASTSGAKTVAVTTIGGTASLSSAFTYVAPPTIASVSPSSGPLAGGTTITVTGANLAGAAVTVGGAAATNVLVNPGGTSLTASVPASATVGTKTVTVTTAGGTASRPSAFTHVALPTIASVSPNAGPLAGDTVITITGTNLTGATVMVGDAAATDVRVNSSGTSLTAHTPASVSGAKTVAVTTVGGTVSLPSAFTHVAPPTLASVSPDSGPHEAGNTVSVTITGTNLAGATVKFGTAAATNVAVNANGTSLTARTPASTPGIKTVTVTTVGGTASLSSAFTYVALPTIASVSPSSGPLAGGTSITVKGTNLRGASVMVGGAPADAVVVNASGTSLTANAPGSDVAGAKTVAVTTIGGTASRSNAFTHVAPPTVAGVSPSSGPLSAGTIVTIAGTNLAGATVKFGDVAATNVVVNAQGTSLTARAPASTSGAKTVDVTTIGGTASLSSAFTYVALPTIASVSPSSGPLAGGTTITVTGTNLADAIVTVGDAAATQVLVNSGGTSLTASVPASATVGTKNVTVTTVGGTASRPSAFTHVALPTM